MNISSWNGTLSSDDFYAAALTLSEKWKQMNPAFPSWKWVPLRRSPWVASHEDDGYLSLENFCIIKSNEEVHDERALTDGRFLALDDIKEDLPPSSLKMLQESKWTFITPEEHPYLNRPWYTLHPCATSEWMKLLYLSDDSLTKEKRAIQLYLVSWLSVVGPVVGLRIPLGMLNNSRQLSPSSFILNGSSHDETLRGIVHTQSSLG